MTRATRTRKAKPMAQSNTGPAADNRDSAPTSTTSSPAGARPGGAGASSPPQAPILLKRAKRQYLISSIGGSTAAAIGLQSLPPVGLTNLRDTIRALGIDVVGVVPGLLPATLGVGQSGSGGFFVTEIEPARAEALRNNVPPNIAIEENHRLGYGAPPMKNIDVKTSLSLAAAGITQTFPITLRIVGRGGAPIEGAMVQLASDGLSEGKTDANGLATVNLILAPGGRARLLYVDIPRDHWDIYIQDPAIAPGQSFEVRATSLFEAPELLPNFPAEFRFGWGQRLMELDRISANCDGAGVRIAIINSGADRTHPLLQHIQQGFDATQENMIGGNWAQDMIGHGTHCAGIITARPANGHAMRGFASAAEIIVFKIFPGGDFTALARCINKCVELQVDIVNLSLGASVNTNLAVEQTMEAAVRSGVAFIVAAGNSGSDVQYPASSRYAMAVAALGAQGMFPENTYDESTFDSALPMVEALFSPNFTCRGPQIAVTAPGVSIVSSWPNGYNPELRDLNGCPPRDWSWSVASRASSDLSRAVPRAERRARRCSVSIDPLDLGAHRARRRSNRRRLTPVGQSCRDFDTVSAAASCWFAHRFSWWPGRRPSRLPRAASCRRTDLRASVSWIGRTRSEKLALSRARTRA